MGGGTSGSVGGGGTPGGAKTGRAPDFGFGGAPDAGGGARSTGLPAAPGKLGGNLNLDKIDADKLKPKG